MITKIYEPVCSRGFSQFTTEQIWWFKWLFDDLLEAVDVWIDMIMEGFKCKGKGFVIRSSPFNKEKGIGVFEIHGENLE